MDSSFVSSNNSRILKCDFNIILRVKLKGYNIFMTEPRGRQKEGGEVINKFGKVTLEIKVEPRRRRGNL